MARLTEDFGGLSVYHGPYSAHLYHSYGGKGQLERDWVVERRIDSTDESGPVRFGWAFAGQRKSHTQRYTIAESAFRFFLDAVRDMVYLWPEPGDDEQTPLG